MHKTTRSWLWFIGLYLAGFLALLGLAWLSKTLFGWLY